jgi:hypothetical protein
MFVLSTTVNVNFRMAALLTVIAEEFPLDIETVMIFG